MSLCICLDQDSFCYTYLYLHITETPKRKNLDTIILNWGGGVYNVLSMQSINMEKSYEGTEESESCGGELCLCKGLAPTSCSSAERKDILTV